jgi:HK97 family phage portal protein
MAILQDIKKFFGFSPPAKTIGSQFTTKIVGSFNPYIGADDKTRYINDFETIKYVYAVISWIAKKAAKVPFKLYQSKTDGSRESINVNQLLNRLEKPNSYQNRFNFLYQFYGYLLATGAGYIYIPKLSSGRFTEMHVIPSDFVQPVYERTFEGPTAFIIKDSGMTISPDEMIYVFNENLKYEVVGVGEDGLSPMRSLRTVTQKTKDIDKADLATIQNGGVVGIITDKSAEMGLDAQQEATLEKKLQDKAYGPENKGKWLLTSGDVSFIPIGMSPIDLNLYQANMQVLRDICIVYHVPYIIFDQTDTNASFGTAMSEARRMAYTDAILPIVEMFVDNFNGFGISGFGQNLVLDYDTSQIEELSKDAKIIAEKLSIEWWKSLADKQRESGMEVNPKFEDVYLIPSNLVRFEDFSIEAEALRVEEEFRRLGDDL